MSEKVNKETEALRRREEIDELLSNTFNSILRVEERMITNRLTQGLTITEIHTLVAIGMYERNPMNVAAARLGVTLATLTTAVNKLVDKGFVARERAEDDRRKVLVFLTKKGRMAHRAHDLFHKEMIKEALSGLNEQEEQVLTEALVQVKRFFDQYA